ncbi:MAG: hypothetical protein HYV63_08925 [Candidatus Schekmanbacteria bacterium]|nr:hypothetical protein [Candidatus Schekmanbacteria bacterium]
MSRARLAWAIPIAILAGAGFWLLGHGPDEGTFASTQPNGRRNAFTQGTSNPGPSRPATVRTARPVATPEKVPPLPSPSPFSQAEWDLFEQTKLAAESLQMETRRTLDALAQEGATLSPSAARAIEDRLASAPDNPHARVRLLGYYASHPDEPGAWDRRDEHLLWLTEHHPELPFSGSAWGNLVHGDDPVAYEQAERLWIIHTNAAPDDPAIALNAALFFAGSDPRYAGELLAKVSSTLEQSRRGS